MEENNAMVLVTKWYGVFLCQGQNVMRYQLFPFEAKVIAKRLAAVQRGEILEEERKLAVKRMKVAEPRLAKLGKPILFDSSFLKPEKYGMSMALMQEVMVELGKVRTREPLSEDRSIAQAIRATDDLIEHINIMSERLHEWYGLHFPELADYAKDDRYAELIALHGTRDQILPLLELDLESVGSEMLPQDVAALQAYANSLHRLYQEKAELDRYILEGMGKVAPNLTALLSANLAARLISLSGGLVRLARFPASTVQVLGAEKALFSHLRSGKRPPKHGIIFQHPMINRSPYWQRGKIARSLAGKAAIAAKVDLYKGEFIGDRLLSEMETRVAEIKQKYPEPPKREPRPPAYSRPGGPHRSKVYKQRHN